MRAEVSVLKHAATVGIGLIVFIAGVFFFWPDAQSAITVATGEGQAIQIEQEPSTKVVPKLVGDQIAQAENQLANEVFSTSKVRVSVKLKFVEHAGLNFIRSDIAQPGQDGATSFEGVSSGNYIRIVCDYQAGTPKARVMQLCNDKVAEVFGFRAFSDAELNGRKADATK